MLNSIHIGLFKALLTFVPVTGPLEAQVTEYGIYITDPDDQPSYEINANATNPRLTFHSVPSIHSETTRQVPIVKDLAFGFYYEISGLPNGEVELDWEVQHPPMQLPDGTLSKGYKYKKAITVSDNSYDNYSAYSFDEDYEMVAGTWIFRYSYEGTPLVEETFTSYYLEQ